ncbi:carbon-nitrogen hydrolase family protein [Dechloromonas sp.]|uniref:carbon-nitrogen hydrolase family protein n=1 Tax=Dechloromonas sp. TaxID=1917218 RepID=UPI0011FEDD6D|nr:carbon-nitrogen hydrolase family protein [Dechloromonas sp.]MBU3696620.1 carbon-nitrogen hydrolase family protein [Dechloromonas sp.]TEX44506.1 MAG: acyltransferase [Rhodocyclaceae bacterium]
MRLETQRLSKQNCVLAGIQMVSGPRVADNLKTAGQLIAQVADLGAQLVALPEYFPIIGAADADRVRAREAFGSGTVQDWLAETAQRHNIWLFAGSIPLVADAPDKMRNSSLAYDPQGACVARYDKIHLFGFRKGDEAYDEAAFIEPGSAPVAVDTAFGRVALSICYDLRFPELYRGLGAVDLILMPAAFTDTTGRAHWEILLRARAIENQCYLLAIGQGGRHENGRMTHGNSMVVDPWGEILDRKLKGPGWVMAELDHARIAEIRASLPALAHRKL